MVVKLRYEEGTRDEKEFEGDEVEDIDDGKYSNNYESSPWWRIEYPVIRLVIFKAIAIP